VASTIFGMIFSRVLLPEPVALIMPHILPLVNSKEMSLSAQEVPFTEPAAWLPLLDCLIKLKLSSVSQILSDLSVRRLCA
jgi:hypothetical protein